MYVFHACICFNTECIYAIGEGPNSDKFASHSCIKCVYPNKYFLKKDIENLFLYNYFNK